MKIRSAVALIALAISFAVPTFAQERNAVTPKGSSEREPIVTFDAPGAGKGVGQGTFVTLESGINSQGTIIGWSTSANATHGYLRESNGTLILFDPPGSVITSPAPLTWTD